MKTTSYVDRLVQSYAASDTPQLNKTFNALYAQNVIAGLIPSLEQYFRAHEQTAVHILRDADLELSRRGIHELTNAQELAIVSGDLSGPITELYQNYIKKYQT